MPPREMRVVTSAASGDPSPLRTARGGAWSRRAARWFEWVTRSHAIREARLADSCLEKPRRALALARRAARAGDRFLDPPDGTQQQPELAMPLYREAALWLLRALVPALEERSSLSEQLTRAAELAEPTRKARLLARPAPAALSASSGDFSALHREAQLTAARACQRWLESFFPALTSEYEQLLRLRLERTLRCSVLVTLGIVLVLLLGSGIVALSRGADLAAGKPWRTSSTAIVCNPAAELCGGAKSRIFFHTSEEANPWLEIDLLKATTARLVEVVNRSDSGAERAVPLRIELSLDGHTYWTVAENTETFSTWNASFPRQSARYVRLTVMRRSILHLERVTVRP